MEYLVPAALIIIVFFIYYSAKLQEEIEDGDTHQKPSTSDTVILMYNTLSSLGCVPTKNDDGSMIVKYQGETFEIVFKDMYARIWNPAWSRIKADDPELSNLRKAVNAANFNFGPTVLITDPNDEGLILLYSRIDIMLHPACPDNISFIREVLDSFFASKEAVREHFQQIKAQQMEAQKKCRPVGFTTPQSTTQK